jgi:hypothetical protein
MDASLCIPLELKPDDYKRYKEVRHQKEKDRLAGKLHSSFTGVDPKPLNFSRLYRQMKNYKPQGVNMKSYPIRIVAQKWGINWQSILAMTKSGAIPSDKVTKNGHIEIDYVDGIAQSPEKVQELLRLHKELHRNNKRKGSGKSTLPSVKPTTTKDVREDSDKSNAPLVESMTIKETDYLKDDLFISILKNLIHDAEVGGIRFGNWRIEKQTNTSKGDNIESCDYHLHFVLGKDN